jgi:hypothetical protein
MGFFVFDAFAAGRLDMQKQQLAGERRSTIALVLASGPLHE